MGEQRADPHRGAQELIDHLQAENQRLIATLQAQAGTLHQRAEPLALAVLDTLTRCGEFKLMTQRPYRCLACRRERCVFRRLGLAVVVTRCVFCGLARVEAGAWRTLGRAG